MYLSWRLSTQCLGEFKHGVEVATLNRKMEDENIGRVHPSRFWFTISRVSLSMSCFLLFKALVLITLGSNNFVNIYYLVPKSARSRQFALPNYVLYLISEYQKIVMVILPSMCYILLGMS